MNKYTLYFIFLFVFFVQISQGQTDILVSPYDSAVYNSNIVNFVWDKEDQHVNYYELSIAENSGFTLNNSVYPVFVSSDTAISGLPTPKTYYWKVRSFNGANYSAWSRVRKFSTINLSSNSSLLFWMKADSGVIADGAMKVNTWKDLSSNANDAVQITAISQPVLINNVAALNGKSVIRMDGVDDYLTFNPVLTIRDCFFLFKHKTGTQTYASILGDNIQPQFHGGFTNQMFDVANGYVDSKILFGKLRMNGWDANINTLKRPSQYSILSVFPTGNCRASTINKDRARTDRLWNGDYTEIIMFSQPLADSERFNVEQYLRFKYAPPVTLGKNKYTDLCGVTTLDAGSIYANYLWSTGETTPTISTTGLGKYWVRVKDIFGYVSTDTIEIRKQVIFNQPAKNLAICPGGGYLWDSGYPLVGYTFTWQDGSSSNKFNITSAGKHYVKIKDLSNCTFYSDTVYVTLDNFSSIATLGPDTNFCSGNSIYLKVGASQALSYLWSNGSTNDSLTVLIAGQYSLTATSANGCVKNDVINIGISGVAPIVSFSVTANNCIGSSTQFTDASSPPPGGSIVSRTWDFGDFSVPSKATSPLYTYGDTGTYIVKLTATTNIGCSASLSKKVTIAPYPQGSFTFSNLCERDSVLFAASATTFGYPITQWGWSFGEPTAGPGFVSTVQNPKHYYATANTYTVSLTIQNNYGCSTTINNSLVIQPAPVTSFSTSLLCEKQTIIFTDNTTVSSSIAIQSGAWDFGDNSGLTPLLNPIHTYTISGNYTLSHTVTANNGCSNIATQTITVNPTPTALYAASNACVGISTSFSDTTLISSGAIVSRLWTYGVGGSTSTLKNDAHTFVAAISPQIKLLVTSDHGCKDSIAKTIVVHPTPISNFTSTPNNGAPPLNVNFSNSSTGAIKYKWDLGNTLTDTLQNTSTIYTIPGHYNVSLIAISQYSCADTNIKIVDVLLPVIDVEVQSINKILNGNYMTIVAVLVNKGTVDVTTLEITVKLSDGTEIKQNWTGLLTIGGVVLDTINTAVYVKDLKSYVCVSALKPNGLDDQNPSDNESCIAIDKSSFEVLSAYPIPAGDFLTIPLLIPASKNLEVLLYNARGQNVRTVYSGIISVGLQLINADLIGLAKGVYFFRVMYEGETITKRFVID